MKMNPNSERCPRCGEGRLRSWAQLSEEERELVHRLPASAEYEPEERKATHRWCAKCWHETTEGDSTVA